MLLTTSWFADKRMRTLQERQFKNGAFSNRQNSYIYNVYFIVKVEVFCIVININN